MRSFAGVNTPYTVPVSVPDASFAPAVCVRGCDGVLAIGRGGMESSARRKFFLIVTLAM